MAGGVKVAVQCPTWKFTTKSFAATLAMIPSGTSSPFALRATPLRITAEEFLTALTYGWIPESSYEWAV
jgi:hypothetical protein